MRNRNLALIVSVTWLATNSAYAMLLAEEQEFGEGREKLSPIPITRLNLPGESTENTVFPVVERKISKTLKLDRRRKSSGSRSAGKKETVTISPRQSSGFVPPEGKKVSPRASLFSDQVRSPSPREEKKESPKRLISPRQITASPHWDEQSGSTGRDESPIRQRTPEPKFFSQGEQSGSPVSPRTDFMGYSGGTLTISQGDREVSPIPERKDSLPSPKQTESLEQDRIIVQWRIRKGSTEGMRKVSLADAEKQAWGDILATLKNPTGVSSQEKKIDPQKSNVMEK